MKKPTTILSLATLLALAGTAAAQSVGENTPTGDGTFGGGLTGGTSDGGPSGMEGMGGGNDPSGLDPSTDTMGGESGTSGGGAMGTEEQAPEETAIPAEQTATGKVTKLNKKAGTLSLNTPEGDTLRLYLEPSMLEGKGIKKGSEVTARYEKRNGRNEVTEIMMSESGTSGGGSGQPATPPLDEGGASQGGGMGGSEKGTGTF